VIWLGKAADGVAPSQRCYGRRSLGQVGPAGAGCSHGIRRALQKEQNLAGSYSKKLSTLAGLQAEDDTVHSPQNSSRHGTGERFPSFVRRRMQ